MATDESASGLTSEQVLALILPAAVSHGYGGHLVGSDGADYIDMVSAWGANLLGYGHRRIARAVAAQSAKYTNLGLAGPEFATLQALLVQHVPCAEAIHLVKNGSDATAAAVRLARAITGRDKVLHRGYHGVHDWYMAASRVPGVPLSQQANIVSLATLDPAAVHALLAANAGEVACLILDPLAWPIPDAAAMGEIAAMVAAAGALLIFDEVVSGFRVAIGGMQEVWGVIPDLACLGKGLANGQPLAALVGRERVMRHLPSINFSLTFGLEALSIVAAIETIREVVERNVPGELARKGRFLKSHYNERCRMHGIPSTLVGHDSRPILHFEAMPGLDAGTAHFLAVKTLAQRRISTYGTFSLCHAHTDTDLAAVVEGLAQAVEAVGKARDRPAVSTMH